LSGVNRFSFSFVGLLILASAAQASGDTDTLAPSAIANRYEPPQVFIKRILESDRSAKTKCAAIARFVKIGDSMDALEKRLGPPREGVQGIYFIYAFDNKSGLIVQGDGKEVICIVHRTPIGMVQLSRQAKK
jgi:hypothetical protein